MKFFNKFLFVSIVFVLLSVVQLAQAEDKIDDSKLVKLQSDLAPFQ